MYRRSTSLYILITLLVLVLVSTSIATSRSDPVAPAVFRVQKSYGVLKARCIVGGEEVGVITLVPQRYGSAPLYDYKLSIRMYPGDLVRSIGSDLGFIVIIRYELVVNGTTIKGFIASEEQSITVRLSQFCKCRDLSRVEIRSLLVTVNFFKRGSWELFVAGSIDLGEALGEYDMSSYFIKGLDNYYFGVEKEVIDEYWVNYKIVRRGKEIGVIKITSHGPFNSSTAVRIFYDLEDRKLAKILDTRLRLSVVVRNDTRVIEFRLRPGYDVILPEEILGVTGEKPLGVESLLVLFGIPYYSVSINATRDIGVVVFDWAEPVYVEEELVKINETRVAPGVLVTYHLLPRLLDPDNIRVYFEPRSGSIEPLYVISGIVWNNETSRIYLKSILVFGSQGLVDGEVIVESRGAERVVTLLRGSIGPVVIDSASIVFTDIPVKYMGTRISPWAASSNGPLAEIISRHGLSREFTTLGGGVVLYLDLGGAVLDPFDLVVVELEFRLRPIDPVYKVWTITFPRTVYEDWVEMARRSMFFLNSTSSSTYSFYWENKTYKLTYTIPAQALVKYEIAPALDGLEPRIRFYGLGLLFLNVEDLEVVSVSARLVDYNGVGGEQSTAPLLTGLGILSTAIATTVLVLWHRRTMGIEEIEKNCIS